MADIRRAFKGDRWTRIIGSRVPVGAVVRVIRFCPRRRVLVEYGGDTMLTMLWCLATANKTGTTW